MPMIYKMKVRPQRVSVTWSPRQDLPCDNERSIELYMMTRLEAEVRFITRTDLHGLIFHLDSLYYYEIRTESSHVMEDGLTHLRWIAEPVKLTIFQVVSILGQVPDLSITIESCIKMLRGKRIVD